MAEIVEGYMRQMKEDSRKDTLGAAKRLFENVLNVNGDGFGRNRVNTIVKQVYDEIVRAGVRIETLISSPYLEDLPPNDRQTVESILSKYRKNY